MNSNKSMSVSTADKTTCATQAQQIHADMPINEWVKWSGSGGIATTKNANRSSENRWYTLRCLTAIYGVRQIESKGEMYLMRTV